MVFKISGTHYYDFKYPFENDIVFLKPEPLNEFDPDAVAIYNCYNQHIGYVPRLNRINQRVLKLLNSGKPIISRVALVNNVHKLILIHLDIKNPSNGHSIKSLKNIKINLN